jgi:hypothetical protein
MINSLLAGTQGLLANPNTLLIGIQGLLTGEPPNPPPEPISRECFINKTTDYQLYNILIMLSHYSGYELPSKECFVNLPLDYQLYQILRALPT